MRLALVLFAACNPPIPEPGDETGDTGCAPWYLDGDGDGWGGAEGEGCERTADAVDAAGDCDDTNASVRPDAGELCNGADDDCDAAIDEEPTDGTTWYTDADGDGWGGEAVVACDQPAGSVETAGDCNDGEDAVSPDATESCNGEDDDCDAVIDEEPQDGTTWYRDADGDGWGLQGDTAVACELPEGYSAQARDCDDTDDTVGGEEDVCDGIDNDCDGVTDHGNLVPTDHASIQDAIDALASGDTICVAPGTYFETIDFAGKDLAIEGFGGVTIDGGGVGPVVTFAASEGAGASLRGVTVTGGEAADGAGIYVERADPTLEDVEVMANACTGAIYACAGTGVYLYESDATLTRVVIRDNLQSPLGDRGLAYGYGAGIYAGGGSPVFTDVEVEGNMHVAVATDASVRVNGAGAWLDDGVTWTGGTAVANTVSADNGMGGGIFVGSSAAVSILRVVVAENVADEGAGIYVAGGTLALTNVVVAGNTGAGITNDAATLGLTNVDVVGNTVGLYLSDDGATNLLNTGVAGNLDGVVGMFGASYSNFYDNGAEPFDAGLDPVGVSGNVAVEPGYTDTSAAGAASWDLRLVAGSRLIDAGDPGVYDADGTRSDVGGFGGLGGGW